MPIIVPIAAGMFSLFAFTLGALDIGLICAMIAGATAMGRDGA